MHLPLLALPPHTHKVKGNHLQGVPSPLWLVVMSCAHSTKAPGALWDGTPSLQPAQGFLGSSRS